MGFALELANAGNSGLPDAWEVPSGKAPRGKPARTRRFGLVGVARRAMAAVTTLPTLGDHRRAF